jgi:hypothetical protein
MLKKFWLEGLKGREYGLVLSFCECGSELSYVIDKRTY